MRDRLRQRAASEAECRGADRTAENVQRRHCNLESVAFLTQARCNRNATALEPHGAERMRRDRLDAFSRRASRRRRVDRECGQSFGASVLRSSEDHVEIRDARVGYPRFLAIDDVCLAVASRARRERGDIGTGLALRQREGGHAPALRHILEIASLELFAAEERNRAAPKALHGKCKIGQRRARGERFAQDAKRAHVDPGA